MAIELYCFSLQFVGVEGFVTAVVDRFPNQIRRGYRKEALIGVVCLFSFFIGLSMITNVSQFCHFLTKTPIETQEYTIIINFPFLISRALYVLKTHLWIISVAIVYRFRLRNNFLNSCFCLLV